jgi:anti-sigma factor RsiW
MKDKHITQILEGAAFAALNEAELSTVLAHTAQCAACRRAFEAAQASATLLKERAAEAFEPSPFFRTRVLAALRERRAAQETSVFERLWRASRALVASMAATVATLAVLTFFVPGIQPAATTQEFATASSSYSADEVLFNRNDAPGDPMTDEQVLTTLYESEEGAVK